MSRFSTTAGALFAAILAACAQPGPAPAPAPMPPASACSAEPARFAVGQQATAALLEEARRRAGASRARILRPGQVVTMEFDGSRLNLQVDAGDRVLAVRCG
jgi:hypothetical protein